MNIIARSQVSASVVVSTVAIREGRATWYETAAIVNGVVTDGARSARKAEALIAHDAACDCVRGFRKDAANKTDAFWMGALAEVAAWSWLTTTNLRGANEDQEEGHEEAGAHETASGKARDRSGPAYLQPGHDVRA